MAVGVPQSGWPRLSVHPTFLLLVVLGLLAGLGPELAAIFGSVLAHELAHVAVAALCHLRARRITLYPFGGVAELPELPVATAGARVLTLAAGPVASLALFLGAPAFEAGGAVQELSRWIRALQQANLGLLIANLLPVGPLDGGRLLEMALERWMGIGVARRRLLQAGLATGMVLALAGSIALALGKSWGSLALFGLFLAVASHRERAGTLFSVLTWCLRGPRPVAVGPARLLVAPSGARTREVASRLGSGPYRLIAVVGQGGRVRGLLGEGEIAEAMNTGAGESSLADLLECSGEPSPPGPTGSEPVPGRRASAPGSSGMTGRTEEPL